jgi:hypothetical protein
MSWIGRNALGRYQLKRGHARNAQGAQKNAIFSSQEDEFTQRTNWTKHEAKEQCHIGTDDSFKSNIQKNNN